MTETATSTKKKAPAKPKAPIVHAGRWIGKQIQQINESPLDQGVKTQVADWLTGIQRALQTIEQVVDAGNPPPPDSVHGRLIALGRSQRTLAQVLAGGATDDEGDEDEDEGPLGDAGAAGAALGARAGQPAAQARTAATIGV